MNIEKRNAKGELEGHYQVSDEAVARHKVFTLKIRGEADRKTAKHTAPKGMKLLVSDKGARDEFGEHDLYVYGEEDAVKFVEADDEVALTPRIALESAKETVAAKETVPGAEIK